MNNQIEIKLNNFYWSTLVFLSIFYGAGIFIHLFYNNKIFPKYIDKEGITTRQGKHYLWKDVTNKEIHDLYAGSSIGFKIASSINFYFDNQKISFRLGFIKNNQEVSELLLKILGDYKSPSYK